jgi:hypothetical protein
MVRLRIIGAGGSHDELLSLRDWLSADDDLRGRVELEPSLLADGSSASGPVVKSVARRLDAGESAESAETAES